jgi:uncharacterized protein (TIRG00374 family)
MPSFLIKVAVTAVLLGGLAFQVDLRRAFVRLGSIGPGTIAACLCLSLLQFTALAYRWNLINRILGMAMPFAQVLRCTLACQFFSQGLPASMGGDALRIWWLSRLGTPMGRAVQSTLLDRIAGLIALAALNLLSVTMLLLLHSDMQNAASLALVVIATMLSMGLGASRVMTRVLVGLRVGARAVLGPASPTGKILAWCVRLQIATRRLVYSLRGLGVLAWGLAIHLATVAVCYAVAMDAGFDVTLLQLVAVVPAVMLLSYLPLSIGGWGLREGAMAFALTLIGLPKEDGAFLGLALGSLSLGAALIGAFVWLFSPMPITLFGRYVAKRSTPAL